MAVINIGGQQLMVADACSGFRFVVILIALGAVFAYLQNTTFLRKCILLGAVVPLAIMGNILRITITGFICVFIGPAYAEGFLHDLSGYILFVFTVLGLITIASFLERKDRDEVEQ